MTFDEILAQVVELLQREGRVAYRALKRRFDLDDDYLEDLKADLIDAKRVAVDEEGKVLVWVGDGEKGETANRRIGESETSTQPPAAYTPTHLAERIRAEQSAMEARGVTDGERKTITALFADLKGSTALIEDLDPEEARAIIDPALQLMMDAVHRYEGYVAQSLGDGIFALFGAPIAHEDHPQRALYAALRMQEEMRRYSDQLRRAGRAPLQMRIGVNTGEVVVRSIRKDDLHTDYVPVGHSTNLAARMEQLANPGSVLVTEYTHKLTDGYFEFKALGETQVKGVEAPLNVYEVLGAGPLRTRLQVAIRRGLTRFVGRQGELDQMRRALDQAKAGHGQIVGVMGEPGLGKSRLFYEFKLTSQSGCLVLEAYSVSHGKASPYLPLIELLKTYFQIQPHDDERQRQEKVTGKVLTLDRSLEDTLPYLFTLLGIDDPTASLQHMDLQIRRRRTFDALKKLFLRESLNQPLILIFEDLHWIDTETQGFLDTLSESVASAKILLLTNYRPEYRHEWGQKTYYTQLRLVPLGKDEAEEFLTALLGDAVGAQHAAPLQSLKHLILQKTDGTPFFMEEVVQTLAEEGALVGARGNYRLEKVPTELHISPTVQGVLAARIDRLTADEKAFLQQLAVIGREFSLSLVRQVVTQPEEELYRLLASLQNKEFLYEQPAFPEVEYIFKHALTQEVAYRSLLLERRKVLHERIGGTIEALYASSLDDHLTELAHHFSQSGNASKALQFLELAGKQAASRSAVDEAILYLTRALETLHALPPGDPRDRRELRLQMQLSTILVAKGFGLAERGRVLEQARALASRLGTTQELVEVMGQLCQYHIQRQQLSAARVLAVEALSLAEPTRDTALILEAEYNLGETAFWLGNWTEAAQHWQRTLSLYDRAHHGQLYLSFGMDPWILGAGLLAVVEVVLGKPDHARRLRGEIVERGGQLGHALSQAIMLSLSAWVDIVLNDMDACRNTTEALTLFSEEQGLSEWKGWGMVWQGWTRLAGGDPDGAIDTIASGLADLDLLDSHNLDVYGGIHLARAKIHKNDLDGAARALREAAALAERYSAHWIDFDLSYAEADLMLKRGLPDEAEQRLRQAIAIAQQRELKWYELRATTSLARLLDKTGRGAEARAMLAEIYNWFTEGFDTKDLQEAKGLLDSLGSSV